MTGHPWLDLIIGVAAALLLAWIALIITLAIRRPKGDQMRESLRASSPTSSASSHD